MGRGQERSRFLSHSFGEMRVDEGSGNDIKNILSHSVKIQEGVVKKGAGFFPTLSEK